MSTNNLSTPASGRFSLSAAALHILAMVLVLIVLLLGRKKL